MSVDSAAIERKIDQVLIEQAEIRSDLNAVKKEMNNLALAQERTATTLSERCASRQMQIQTVEQQFGVHQAAEIKEHDAIHNRVTAISNKISWLIGAGVTVGAVGMAVFEFVLKK